MSPWRPARWLALATIALAVALGLRPISVREIVAAYVLALAAIALAVLTRLNARDPWDPGSAFAHALRRRRPERARPAELVRMERELTLANASAGHLHARLLPLLREAAAARLAAHHRLDLVRSPEEVRRRLGDDAWELVRPDRPAPKGDHAPGMRLRDIGKLIESIERL